MRTITLYRHGVSMGTPTSKPNKTPPKRGEVQGWSQSATRRNISFLRSVDENAIQCTEDGEELIAVALTLTVRNCPDTHADWQSIRRAFQKRLERMGLYRSHWVTEWQRRGVPHLHGAFWFPRTTDPLYYHAVLDEIIGHWLGAAASCGAAHRGQQALLIFDAVGWFKYLSKHAARGVHHYQRSAENIPEGWQKTGRIWGHTGPWPLIEPEKRIISDLDYFRMRRLARNWRKADARKSGNRFRIRTARKMLRHNHPEKSKLRGVSEWIPEATALALLDFARSQGVKNEH